MVKSQPTNDVRRTTRLNRKTSLLCLAGVGLTILLLLAACGPQPTADIEATAQALAHLWATQTSQAQPPTSPAEPVATDTPAATVPTAATSEPPAPPPTGAPTSTATPILTGTPTPTETPSPTPTETPSPTPACPVAVDASLAAAWDRSKLGCPTADAATIWAAWQPFEHGYMFWRSDLDWTYMLNWQDGVNQSAGGWSSGEEAWRWDGISFPNGRGLTPQPGLYEPVRGFGFVWFDKLGGPGSSLGWATDQEKGLCVNLQPFEQGLIFHSSTVEHCQDELDNWARDPSFSPLFFSLNNDLTWQRH